MGFQPETLTVALQPVRDTTLRVVLEDMAGTVVTAGLTMNRSAWNASKAKKSKKQS